MLRPPATGGRPLQAWLLAVGGILLLCRLTVVVRLLAAEVKVHKEQAVKNSNRVGAVVAISLTRHLLPTSREGLLMMIKAN
jgi:hypothetical protein